MCMCLHTFMSPIFFPVSLFAPVCFHDTLYISLTFSSIGLGFCRGFLFFFLLTYISFLPSIVFKIMWSLSDIAL